MSCAQHLDRQGLVALLVVLASFLVMAKAPHFVSCETVIDHVLLGVVDDLVPVLLLSPVAALVIVPFLLVVLSRLLVVPSSLLGAGPSLVTVLLRDELVAVTVSLGLSPLEL